MAVTKIVLRSDDVTGASDESVEAFTFKLPVFNEETGSLDSVNYTLDASDETRDRINEAKAKAEQAYARAMAKALNFAIQNAKSATPRKASSNGSDGKAVREWARSAGYSVGDRGRIPEEVMTAFLAAHPVTDSETADA